MRARIGSALLISLVALGIGSMSGGVASGQPANPFGGPSAARDSATRFVYVRNAGTVARVTTTGNTATFTVTAPDHTQCNSAVFAGTSDELIAREGVASTVPPVDIPGPDAFVTTSPSLRGVPYITDIPADELSPVVKSATLPSGRYTALSYCQKITDAGELDQTVVNPYYLEDFTLPSTTTPPATFPRFGSS